MTVVIGVYFFLFFPMMVPLLCLAQLQHMAHGSSFQKPNYLHSGIDCFALFLYQIDSLLQFMCIMIGVSLPMILLYTCLSMLV